MQRTNHVQLPLIERRPEVAANRRLESTNLYRTAAVSLTMVRYIETLRPQYIHRIC